MAERVPVLLRLKPEIKRKLDFIRELNSKAIRVDLSMNRQLERLIEDEFDRLVNTGNK
jgi:hypothetical protein